MKEIIIGQRQLLLALEVNSSKINYPPPPPQQGCLLGSHYEWLSCNTPLITAALETKEGSSLRLKCLPSNILIFNEMVPHTIYLGQTLHINNFLSEYLWEHSPCILAHVNNTTTSHNFLLFTTISATITDTLWKNRN